MTKEISSIKLTPLREFDSNEEKVGTLQGREVKELDSKNKEKSALNPSITLLALLIASIAILIFSFLAGASSTLLALSLGTVAAGGFILAGTMISADHFAENSFIPKTLNEESPVSAVAQIDLQREKFDNEIGNHFDIIKTTGNGSCLFESLSHSYPETKHEKLRHDIVDYMRHHRENFRGVILRDEPFQGEDLAAPVPQEQLDREFDLYCNTMYEGKDLRSFWQKLFGSKAYPTWGGQEEIHAFVKMQEERGESVRVHIFDDQYMPTVREGVLETHPLLIIENDSSASPENKKNIYLLRRWGNHYDILVPKETDELIGSEGTTSRDSHEGLPPDLLDNNSPRQ